MTSKPDNGLYRIQRRQRMRDRLLIKVFCIGLAAPLLVQGCTFGTLELGDYFGWLGKTGPPQLPVPPPAIRDPDWMD